VTGWLARVREHVLPFSEDFNFATFLADPAAVREWGIQGLPSDQYSTENGVIVTRGRRWPQRAPPGKNSVPACASQSQAPHPHLNMHYRHALESYLSTGQSNEKSEGGSGLAAACPFLCAAGASASTDAAVPIDQK
jgi:hypothetical protein